MRAGCIERHALAYNLLNLVPDDPMTVIVLRELAQQEKGSARCL